MGKFFLEEDDLKSCLNKFYECRSIRVKILNRNNPAVIRITNLIEETENYIREKIESAVNENQMLRRPEHEENFSRSVDHKDRNFESTTNTSNTNYKSNLTFYSSRSEPEKGKEQKKVPKFVDFRGLGSSKWK